MRCHEFTVWNPFRCRLRNPRVCRYFDPARAECSKPWLRRLDNAVHA